jgi:hypothetical protein
MQTATTTTMFRIVLMLEAMGIKRLISHNPTPTMIKTTTRLISGTFLCSSLTTGALRHPIQWKRPAGNLGLAKVAGPGTSRASPCGFMPGVLSVAGEVFSCPYDYIFLSGFQCALHGAVMDTGVLQTGIVYVDRKPVHTDGGLNSQLKWAVFRSTTVLDFHG